MKLAIPTDTQTPRKTAEGRLSDTWFAYYKAAAQKMSHLQLDRQRCEGAFVATTMQNARPIQGDEGLFTYPWPSVSARFIRCAEG